jgi:hypothetical protein
LSRVTTGICSKMLGGRHESIENRDRRRTGAQNGDDPGDVRILTTRGPPTMLHMDSNEESEELEGLQPLHVHAQPRQTGFNLSTDDAVLALDANRAATCVFCATRMKSPAGWSLQVSGVKAEEVQRVATALLQQVDNLDGDGDVVHGDKYVVGGSALAVGPQATATLLGDWNQFAERVDVAELAGELAELRAQFAAADLEQAVIIGALACAEKAVLSGDGPGALG